MGEGLTLYLKNEFTGWKKAETTWMMVASAVILALSLSWGDSTLGILAALTGVWCVVLTGMGKSICFVFALVNVLSYAWIAYEARYYGEVMLNTLYYTPMNIIGLYLWARHTSSSTGEVEKRRLSRTKKVYIYLGTAAAVLAYGLFLRTLGGSLPWVDSLTTVLSITAQILTIYRIAEQWLLWIVVNAATIVMWSINFAQGQENLAVLLMWAVYLLNSIYMYIRWSREAKTNEI